MPGLQIPRILAHAEVASRIVPISFEPEKGFLIGPDAICVEPADLSDVVWSRQAAVKDMASLAMGQYNGAWTFTGPVFYDFVETHAGQEAIAQTPEVMLQVFNALSGYRATHDDIAPGFMSFFAERYQVGQVGLNVLGNCACMSVEQEGFIRRQDAHTKFNQYSMHNVDTEVQKISLLAGLGYIAGRATSEVTQTQHSH